MFIPHYVSHITCHMSHVKIIFSDIKKSLKKSEQCGAASWWRVCYQWGLPRLVFFYLLVDLTRYAGLLIILPCSKFVWHSGHNKNPFPGKPVINQVTWRETNWKMIISNFFEILQYSFFSQNISLGKEINYVLTKKEKKGIQGRRRIN